jgi:uncharacterized protein
MNTLPILLNLDQPLWLAFTAGVLVFAYAIFTIAGFGSALLASAPLANVMPVARVIPLLALLDCLGSCLRGWRGRDQVSVNELRLLLPTMLLGQVLGVALLAQLATGAMAVLLGGFVAGYGMLSLFDKVPKGNALTGGKAAMLHGLIGGVLGGLFGSGGFVYASYLQRRLENREAFRATQAVLIGLSTAWRVGLCALAGLIDLKLLLTALVLMPAAALGAFVGKHIDLHLSHDNLTRLMNGLLIASGLSLILRHLF